MRILVVGKFHPEGFALHIAETLCAMGHEVPRFEPVRRSNVFGGRLSRRVGQVAGILSAAGDGVPAIRARRMRALWSIAGSSPLDAVIVCHDFLWPSEVAELKRRTSAPVAMWFPDAIVNLSRGFFMTAPYDAVFFKDPYIVQALGGVIVPPAFYLPECFNPMRHRLPEGGGDPAPYRCDIATAGNLHSWRVALFRHLDGHDVKIWGPPPPLWMESESVRRMHQGRSVLNEEKAMAFRHARIVLNMLHYGEIQGLNVRAFEAAGVGAFQLIDRRPGLSQLFEDGRELVSFRGLADLKEKVAYWLPRDEERGGIALAGMRRAEAEHTYAHRLGTLIGTLAGRERGFPMPTAGGAEGAP